MKYSHDENSWLSAGMAGASFVAVTQLVTRPDLNFMHKAAILLFALCLPCFIICLMTYRDPGDDAQMKNMQSIIEIMLFLPATLVFLAGIFCLFASFGFIYPLAFIIGCSSLPWVLRTVLKPAARPPTQSEKQMQ
jgi:hypothetical protein